MRTTSTVLQSSSSIKGSEAMPLYAGCTPASHTMVFPRYWRTQHDRPTSWPAPKRVMRSVGTSAMADSSVVRWIMAQTKESARRRESSLVTALVAAGTRSYSCLGVFGHMERFARCDWWHANHSNLQVRVGRLHRRAKVYYSGYDEGCCYKGQILYNASPNTHDPPPLQYKDTTRMI